MRDNFAAFILTHGRPKRVQTYSTLRHCGYTGRIVVLIDNEDATAEEYRKLYGAQVEVFDKAEMAGRIDEADNFDNRKAIIYARNACFDVAERLGLEYFIQLDDDYHKFEHRIDATGNYVTKGIRNLDAVLGALLDYYEATPYLSIALAQGGDFIGGEACSNRHLPGRKAMNSFICSTKRRFQFSGRINEDVNTYVGLGSRGGLFLTIKHVSLVQQQTQKSAGGMTETYLDGGTYVKSFYTVMQNPSSVRIHTMGDKHKRIHHQIRWRYAVPMILPESTRKAR